MACRIKNSGLGPEKEVHLQRVLKDEIEKLKAKDNDIGGSENAEVSDNSEFVKPTSYSNKKAGGLKTASA